MAAYLAKAGVDCVVLESALFPRPHVGESLVPSSTRVFNEIGFLDQMNKGGYVHKYGAVWTGASSSEAYSCNWDGLTACEGVDIRFDERPQEGVDQDYTYHVDRAEFDLALLQHADKLGAKVYEGVRVRTVDFSNGGCPKINFRIGDKEIAARARVVVDASGRRTLLGNQMKLRVPDPVFDQFAIHGWFEGYDRSAVETAGRSDYIFIHFLPVTNAWVWQIPITESVTSIGVVTQKKHFAKERSSREEFFWECLATRPDLYEGVRQARGVTPLREEGDYSYAMKRIRGDRFVMIGDAARFVDPIFSSGVSIALNSARHASQDVLEALETGVFDGTTFERYETITRRGTANWYEFISLYYRLNLLFTAFVEDPRYRLDVLQLLQGDVYDEDEPPVLKRMRQIVTAVEGDQNHVWHNLLGDLTSEAIRAEF